MLHPVSLPLYSDWLMNSVTMDKHAIQGKLTSTLPLHADYIKLHQYIQERTNTVRKTQEEKFRISARPCNILYVLKLASRKLDAAKYTDDN